MRRRRLVLEQVAPVGLLTHDLAGAGHPEALLRTAVRLHLRHGSPFSFASAGTSWSRHGLRRRPLWRRNRAVSSRRRPSWRRVLVAVLVAGAAPARRGPPAWRRPSWPVPPSTAAFLAGTRGLGSGRRGCRVGRSPPRSAAAASGAASPPAGTCRRRTRVPPASRLRRARRRRLGRSRRRSAVSVRPSESARSPAGASTGAATGSGGSCRGRHRRLDGRFSGRSRGRRQRARRARTAGRGPARAGGAPRLWPRPSSWSGRSP